MPLLDDRSYHGFIICSSSIVTRIVIVILYAIAYSVKANDTLLKLRKPSEHLSELSDYLAE